MLTFLIYEAKVAAALLVFYLFYRFLLKKETFHRFNRGVLVGTAVLSFLLPLCIVTIHKTLELPAAESVETLVLGGEAAAEPAPAGGAFAVAAVPWWPLALAVLFFAGVVFVLIRAAISLLSIRRIIRRGECVREEDGVRIIVTERDIDPFSWMRYIVLSRKDWAAEHASILTHERAHIAYGHSAELLLVDLLSALQWFNPAIWMLRADLQELHEYEADDAVLRSGANLREYQYLLIRKAVSKSGYSVANSFNHSILKNRITMMSKTKSSALRGLRVLYALPLVGICLAANAQTVIDYKGSENPQTKYYLEPTAINLTVIQEGNDVEYFVNGENVALDAIGEKVSEARGDDASAYVNIIGNPGLKSGRIQEVKEELRKVRALKIQYKCRPDVEVQRRLDPSGFGKDIVEFMASSKEGDVQIRLNDEDRLLYIRGKSNNDYVVLNQEDLFALAKQDIGKNNGISYFFVIDDNSSYGAYSAAVQSVHDAFVAVREDLAMATYGKPYAKLEMAQQDELLEKCRVRIYETGK